MNELQNQMQEKLVYLIGWQNHNEQFSCNASFGIKFSFSEVHKEEEHDNSRNGSKVGNATKEILKRRHGPPLRSDSNVTELNPPAKSPSTPRRIKDHDKTSHKPRKGNIHHKKRLKLYITRNLHSDNVVNLLLLMLVPMQDSKTVMCAAIQMPSFSALQVVFVSLISHQVKNIKSLH